MVSYQLLLKKLKKNVDITAEIKANILDKYLIVNSNCGITSTSGVTVFNLAIKYVYYQIVIAKFWGIPH